MDIDPGSIFVKLTQMRVDRVKQISYGDICWHGGVTDERDVIRTSSMGIRAIRTIMDALWMRYGYLIL